MSHHVLPAPTTGGVDRRYQRTATSSKSMTSAKHSNGQSLPAIMPSTPLVPLRCHHKTGPIRRG